MPRRAQDAALRSPAIRSIARPQDAPELAVREERDISVQCAEMCDEPISTVGNLCGHFTARTAVPEHIPVRSPFVNVYGAPSFIIAVVTFRQVRFNLGPRPQPGQLTRSSRALPRAGQHTCELDLPEAWSKFARLLLAARGQRNVRAARVLAGERPLGFAVSNEVKLQEPAPGGDHLFARFRARLGPKASCWPAPG